MAKTAGSPTTPASSATPTKGTATRAPRIPRGKGVPVIVRGYTLAEIARGIHVNQSYLSKISRGLGTPSLHVLEDARAFLGFATIDETLQALRNGRTIEGRR